MTELEQACNDLGVTLTSTLKGYVPESETNDWAHFSWKVTIHYQGRKQSFDYRTGVGHVNLPKAYQLQLPGPIPADWQTSRSLFCTGLRAQWVNDPRAPIAPSVADVVSSLMSDCSAATVSFDDFCSDFGYDTDSRKARKTWISCSKQLGKCVALFGADMHKLQGLEH